MLPGARTSDAKENAETERPAAGGCALTDVTEYAFNATGPAPASAAITSTSLRRPRNIAMNSSAGSEVTTALDAGADKLLAQH